MYKARFCCIRWVVCVFVGGTQRKFIFLPKFAVAGAQNSQFMPKLKSCMRKACTPKRHLHVCCGTATKNLKFYFKTKLFSKNVFR